MLFMILGCGYKCWTETIRFVLQSMPLQLSDSSVISNALEILPPLIKVFAILLHHGRKMILGNKTNLRFVLLECTVMALFRIKLQITRPPPLLQVISPRTTVLVQLYLTVSVLF